MGIMDKSDLLNELRIGKEHRDDHANGGPHWPWIAVASLVALAAVGAAGWYYVAGNIHGFTVEAATASAPNAGGADTSVLQATGYVTARRAATVSAQITGTLTEVLIEEGERVEKGQVLARLESTQQQAYLAQAQAGARAAQAQLAQVQALLAQNQRDLARQQDIVARKLASQQSLELAQTQVATQAATVAAQRRQVDVALANVQAAQVQLDYCTVRAPFSGMVTAKAAQVGEIVSPLSAGGGFTRTGVGTIVDMDSLEIEVDVNESYISRVVPKQSAQATLDAYPDWKIPAHVIAIIPTADRGKATVKVRIGIDAKDPRILPDMGARVSFFEDASDASKTAAATPPKGVLVPVSAIVRREGKDIVFAIDADHARARTVAPGQTYNDLRLVEGIGAGTRVIKQPPAELSDGAKVEIKSK